MLTNVDYISWFESKKAPKFPAKKKYAHTQTLSCHHIVLCVILAHAADFHTLVLFLVNRSDVVSFWEEKKTNNKRKHNGKKWNLCSVLNPIPLELKILSLTRQHIWRKKQECMELRSLLCGIQQRSGEWLRHSGKLLLSVMRWELYPDKLLAADLKF